MGRSKICSLVLPGGPPLLNLIIIHILLVSLTQAHILHLQLEAGIPYLLPEKWYLQRFYLSAQANVTKYHRLGILNQKSIFSEC